MCGPVDDVIKIFWYRKFPLFILLFLYCCQPFRSQLHGQFLRSDRQILLQYALCRARRFSAGITVEELTNVLSVVDNIGRAEEEHTSLQSPRTTMRIAAVAS